MIAATSSITVIVYTIIEILKYFTKNNEKFKAVIPIIAGVLGAAIATTVYFLSPTLMGFQSLFDAIIIGLVSGLAATGTNQIFKQLTNGN